MITTDKRVIKRQRRAGLFLMICAAFILLSAVEVYSEVKSVTSIFKIISASTLFMCGIIALRNTMGKEKI